MTLPRPAGEPFVVVPVTGGVADVSVLHVPAPYRLVADGGGERRVPFRGESVPYEWPSMCGVEGLVYVRGGVLARTPGCGVCEVLAAPAELRGRRIVADARHGTVHGYQGRGCRCGACTRAHSEYKRSWRSRKQAA